MSNGSYIAASSSSATALAWSMSAPRQHDDELVPAEPGDRRIAVERLSEAAGHLVKTLSPSR